MADGEVLDFFLGDLVFVDVVVGGGFDADELRFDFLVFLALGFEFADLPFERLLDLERAGELGLSLDQDFECLVGHKFREESGARIQEPESGRGRGGFLSRAPDSGEVGLGQVARDGVGAEAGLAADLSDEDDLNLIADLGAALNFDGGRRAGRGGRLVGGGGSEGGDGREKTQKAQNG